MADTAAAIADLDLLVTADTSVAHVAAAMGKPVWIMLPMFFPDWRWHYQRKDSPWYPSVRLFRKGWGDPHDWTAVVSRIRDELILALWNKGR
jgi:ADP-heptose:LPS heptosyltransferase